MIAIPKEVYIAIAGVLLLALIAWGIKAALDQQYDKGDAAGSARASLACEDRIDKIQAAADLERRRLSAIALDLGLELAKRQRALNQLAGRIERESENEIRENPSPVVCTWTDERVRLINDAARGVSSS